MRPGWNEYFMEIAHVVKRRSTCIRRQIGAVIVKDNRILTTGYNGPPPGMKHCDEVGCLRKQLNVPSGERHELCRALHAEQNAIIQAAKSGVEVDGAVIYVTTQPCMICAKLIVASGIKKIVYEGDYPDELSLSFIEEAGVEIVRY